MYQAKVQAAIDRDTDMARKLLAAGRKDRAVALLRMKRFNEERLKRADAHVDNVAQLCGALEFSAVEASVLDGLRLGAEALKDLSAGLSIEGVERIAEDTAEARELCARIAQLMGGELTGDDNDAVKRETDALERELAGEREGGQADKKQSTAAQGTAAPRERVDEVKERLDQLPPVPNHPIVGPEETPAAKTKKKEAVPS